MKSFEQWSKSPKKSLVKLVNSNTFAEAGTAVAEAPRKVSRNLCLPVASRKTRGRAYMIYNDIQWLCSTMGHRFTAWSTRCRAWVFVVHIHLVKTTVIISCSAALQVGTPCIHNDYTILYQPCAIFLPQFKWICKKEQSDERDLRGSSAEEKVNTDAPAEAKTHTAKDVWNLSPKRMGVYRNRQRVLNTAHFSFLSFLEFQRKW